MHLVRSLEEIQWREFIDRHPDSNIFHTPEMYQVFQRTKGYQPELWAVVESDGAVQCLFIPTLNTVLNGLFRYVSTRAVAYGGILYHHGSESDGALSLLLSSYNKEKKNVLFTELRNQADISDIQSPLSAYGFTYEDHLNFIFDLDNSADQLWDNIRSNAKRNIKKAQRSQVIIHEVDDFEGLSSAYQILKDVYSRIEVPLPDISMFEAGFEILRPKGMLKILSAELDGTPIGTLTLLMYKGTITYWYTGILREYAEFRAADMLVWHSLKFGSQGEYHSFDFGGGGKPDESYGVRDFKAKYGGEMVNYGRNIKIHAPLRYQLSLIGYRLIRRYL